MDNNTDWFKKRMDDIPQPVIVGSANLSREQLKKGEEDLLKLIDESQNAKRK